MSKKYNNNSISSAELRALLDKHGTEKVCKYEGWRDGQAKRSNIVYVDPDTNKKEYAYEDVDEKTYTRIRTPEEREYGPRYGFSGETDFGQNSRDIENWAFSQISKEAKGEDDDGNEITVMKLSNALLKKFKYQSKDGKKVPVKVVGGDDIYPKWQGEIWSNDASEEDRKEFKGIHYVNIPDVNEKNQQYHKDKSIGDLIADYYDMRTATKNKKGKFIMSPLVDDEDNAININNIHKLIPSGSRMKCGVRRQTVVSARGGSVPFDWRKKIFVEPREYEDAIDKNFETDEMEELINKYSKKEDDEEHESSDKGTLSGNETD